MKTILLVSYNELNITSGGVHRVNKLMMEGFRKHGYRCLYLINKSGEYFYINNKEIEENKIDREELKQYIIKKNISYVINHEGIFSDTFHKVYHSLGLKGSKLFTIFHSTPSIYEKLYGFNWILSQIVIQFGFKYGLSNTIRLLGYPVWRYISKKNISKRYTNIYNFSDCCVMLSENDIHTLKSYVKNLSTSKCVAIPNALTFESISDISILQKKEKKVLIVSRLNDCEKRISLALKIWQKIQKAGILDWYLTIVGTGPHEAKLKRLAYNLNLINVSFEGKQESEPYYENAALFMMTSASEGWGLTITESMQRGVVPIAFNSYPALSEIITNDYDGCIIKDNDLDAYAQKMIMLMQDDKERERIARNGLESCKRFTIDKYIKQWLKLIEKIG
jgi:glycosyltransferase involved in cell wall biosynthesis